MDSWSRLVSQATAHFTDFTENHPRVVGAAEIVLGATMAISGGAALLEFAATEEAVTSYVTARYLLATVRSETATLVGGVGAMVYGSIQMTSPHLLEPQLLKEMMNPADIEIESAMLSQLKDLETLKKDLETLKTVLDPKKGGVEKLGELADALLEQFEKHFEHTELGDVTKRSEPDVTERSEPDVTERSEPADTRGTSNTEGNGESERGSVGGKDGRDE